MAAAAARNITLRKELKSQRADYDKNDQLNLKQLVEDLEEHIEKRDFILWKNNGRTALAVALDKHDGEGVQAVLKFCVEFVGEKQDEQVIITREELLTLLRESKDSSDANILQRCTEISQQQEVNSDKLPKQVYGCLKKLDVAEEFIIDSDKKLNTVLHTAASDKKTGKLFLYFLSDSKRMDILMKENTDLMTPWMIAIKHKSIHTTDIHKIPRPDLWDGQSELHILSIAMDAGAEYLLAVVKSLPEEYVENQFLEPSGLPALAKVINNDQCQVMNHLAEQHKKKLSSKLAEQEFKEWLRGLPSNNNNNNMRDQILKAMPEHMRDGLAGEITPRTSSEGRMQAIIFYNSENDCNDEADKLDATLTGLHFEVNHLGGGLWNSSTLPDKISAAVSSSCTLLLVIGLTHGIEGFTLDKEGQKTKIEDIQQAIKTTSENVPKIFILDACRVEPEDDSDSENESVNTTASDYVGNLQRVITYNTCSRGEKAYGGGWGGSFINQLVLVLDQEGMQSTDAKPIDLIKVLRTAAESVSGLTDRFANIVLKIGSGNIHEISTTIGNALDSLSTDIEQKPSRRQSANIYKPMLNALKLELHSVSPDCTKLIVTAVQMMYDDARNHGEIKSMKIKSNGRIEKIEEKLVRIQMRKGYKKPTRYLVDGKYLVTVLSFYVGKWNELPGRFESELSKLRKIYDMTVKVDKEKKKEGTVVDVVKLLDDIVSKEGLNDKKRIPRPTQRPEYDDNETRQILLASKESKKKSNGSDKADPSSDSG